MASIEVQLRYNEYIGRFYKRDKHGDWRKFDVVGNTSEAWHFAHMLKVLGHKVTYVNEGTEEQS